MANVRDFGAAGNGIDDDSAAIQHAIEAGDGLLEFPRGVYRLNRTLEVHLDQVGTTGLCGQGGTAKLLMAAAGPAVRIVGTHGGTGDPNSVQPVVWQAQRMPTIRDLEIQGAHPEADGLQLIGTMQSRTHGVLIHQVRHGIHLTGRNRNVLIDSCHIYHNTGVGVLLNDLNLHQINIVGSHISYNRQGGIRIERSEVRNLQITGNDIEYNNYRAFADSHQAMPEPTAEIYIDTTAEGASVNEVTVCSNTIQATISPGGANIRILEQPGLDRPPGLWTISGNIIGSQENNVHLSGCHGIVLSGNFIYSCGHRNLLIESSSQVNVTGNSFRRHTPAAGTGLRLIDCQDCVIGSCTVQDEAPEGQASGASLLELERCRRITVSGSQLLDGTPCGIDASECEQVRITGCTILDTRPKPRGQASVRFRGPGRHNVISGNTLGQVTGDPLQLAPEANVLDESNVVCQG